MHWAIDLGTTNTALAYWDVGAERPRVLELNQICRNPNAEDPLEAPRLVPSATHMLRGDDLWTTLGRSGLLARYTFWGRQAVIGRPALEQNASRVHPSFVRSWKPYLGQHSLRPIARSGTRKFTAREVVRSYLRELLRHAYEQTGTRIRSLAVTAPVDSYESYRAEIREICRSLGVWRVTFVDEPVAAAAGYGITAGKQRIVLVVDFGGGTLDFALVRLDARTVADGECHVVGKVGRPMGGNLVDRWLLDEIFEDLDLNRVADSADEFWFRFMLDEARRVKEQLFFKESEPFLVRMPEEMAAFARTAGDTPSRAEITRDELIEVLTKNGAYRVLQECTEEILEEAQRSGIALEDIDDVLMVGGSTLLPNVFKHFEDTFGRDRVRAWQPFEAVVYGACALTARGLEQSDFIVHDYAFTVYDQRTNERQYEIIVPRGTRFPTKPDLWRRKLVPTCALGEPERMFKLVVNEIGSARDGERAFGWDAKGELHKLGEGDGRLVVPLNEANPTLGHLNPPHPPSDRKPRLDVSFGVNGDRWLCATVIDLKTNRPLMRNEPVVRLL